VTEERKFAILFAATILAARKLIDTDPNKPNMAKGFFVDRAIDDAMFILERIDARWPAIVFFFRETLATSAASQYGATACESLALPRQAVILAERVLPYSKQTSCRIDDGNEANCQHRGQAQSLG
jgi:hypothetical protein